MHSSNDGIRVRNVRRTTIDQESEPEFGAPGMVIRISLEGTDAGVALVAKANGPLKTTSSGMIRKNRVKEWINVLPLLSICFAANPGNSGFAQAALAMKRILPLHRLGTVRSLPESRLRSACHPMEGFRTSSESYGQIGPLLFPETS